MAAAIPDYQALVAALCSLGFAQRLLGRSDAAHASASRALALAEVRPELYPARAEALRVLAEVALNRGEWELARGTLQTAIPLLEELNDRWPLAFAYFGEAEASLQLAEGSLASSEIAYYTVALNFTRFLVRGKAADLRAAHAELQRQAALFRDPQLRAAFVHEVRLYRLVRQLWKLRPVAGALRAGAALWAQLAALYRPVPPTPPGAGRVLEVRLARVNAPLGRPPTPAERVPVRWIVDAGESDARVLQQAGKVALRQHRLRRLLDEAAAQGAAPTDDELAAALGVSRRTVLRDIAQLAQNGDAPATRRRRP